MKKNEQQIKGPAPQTTTILLPEALVSTAKTLGWSRINVNHLLRLLAIGWHEFLSQSSQNEFYLEWSSSYIRKVTSVSFYSEWLRIKEQPNETQKQKEKKLTILFQSNGSYDVERGRAKSYRLNPLLLSGQLTPVLVDIDLEAHSLNHIFPELIFHFDSTIELLSIDWKRLNYNLEEIIQLIPIQKEGYSLLAKTDSDAKAYFDSPQTSISCDRIVTQRSTQYIKGAGLQLLIDRLKESQQTNPENELLVDGKTAFIGSTHNYINRKTSYMLKSAKYAIESVENKRMYRSISANNGRLHSTITNLNSTLLPFCTLEGETIASLDLRSSQPCILSNLLSGNPLLLASIKNSRYPELSEWADSLSELSEPALWQPFLDALLKEDIYRWAGAQNGSSRAWAKQEFMTMLFSAPFYNSPLAPFLDIRFPGFSKSLRTIKRTCIKKFNKPLAVVLQMVEAHIFLEKILSRIAAILVPACTKHDSILFADTRERREQVKGIIDKVFEELGFRGEMKYSSYSILGTDDPLFHSPEGNDYYFMHRYMEDTSDLHLEIQQLLMEAEIGEFASNGNDWSQF